MFRKSKADEMAGFFASSLKSNEVAIFYLSVSGFIVKSLNNTIIFDPAGMLKDDEINTLKGISLVVFTHDHLDHFSGGKTEAIFKSTGAPILAEPKVTNKLKGRIPTEKLVSAESGKTYQFGNTTVAAIQGIHRGPIMLYQVKMDDLAVFHGGDSGYVELKDYHSEIAIVPVGRMSPTASPENALKMVLDIKPDFAITMHGSDMQKQKFEQMVKEAIPQITVIIPPAYSTKIIALRKR